jgi:hypothetical protein
MAGLGGQSRYFPHIRLGRQMHHGTRTLIPEFRGISAAKQSCHHISRPGLACR